MTDAPERIWATTDNEGDGRMTDIETITRLVLILDASIPALNAAARAEEKREAGKPMRQVTEQNRVKFATELVAEISMKYGIPL